jgi:hypothetical protein
VPRFWSDQYDAKLQTVGISRNFDRQAVRGSLESGQFSVFYYRQASSARWTASTAPATRWRRAA